MGFLIMILATVVGFFVLRSLARPSWKSRDASVRRRAVEELTSETLLVRLAATDPDPLVRSAAVKNFHCRDQVLLEERAMDDVDPKVRKAARGRLEYPELLKLIWASSDVSLLSYVKPSATSDLVKLAQSHPDRRVRTKAIERIGSCTNPSVLLAMERIAQNDQEPSVRQFAQERLAAERQRAQRAQVRVDVERRQAEIEAIKRAFKSEISGSAEGYDAYMSDNDPDIAFRQRDMLDRLEEAISNDPNATKRITALTEEIAELEKSASGGLRCSHCKKPNDDSLPTFSDERHVICTVCQRAVLCAVCRREFRRGGAFGCPTCGYHDRWNTVSNATTVY